MTTTNTTTPLQDRLAELETRDDHAETFHHEDGSVTVVAADWEPYDMDSPRDWAGNVATLIMSSPDYQDLDNDVAGLDAARDRWEWMDDKRPYCLDYAGNLTKALYYSPLTREDMVTRYIAMFRPDIAYYCDEWTVIGHMQSDWAHGWGYVTTDALSEAGLTPDFMVLRNMTPEDSFDAELEVYQMHFAGDYYYATHLTPHEPVVVSTVVDYATEPVDTLDDTYDEDTVYGFLGYDNLADIAANFTDSPVRRDTRQ